MMAQLVIPFLDRGGQQVYTSYAFQGRSEPLANCDSKDEPEDRSGSEAVYESSSIETEDKSAS